MRRTKRLTAVQVQQQRKPGLYPDGGGLYLQVTKSKDGNINRSWLYRYRSAKGRERMMGLGSMITTSLPTAREKAAAARRLRDRGTDPIEARNAQRVQARLDEAKAMTFDQCRDAFLANQKAGWKNAKHRDQWTSTLTTYVTPVFGNLSVQDIDVDLVLKVLEPIWSQKPETASRVRGRVEAVLDYAKVRGLRRGENPARWRGHLDKLLPARSKVRKVRHHPALPYPLIGAFMAELRDRGSISARALEFVVLTAVRTGDITGDQKNDKPGAKWNQIDFEARVWTIPSTKTGKEHRVPLSDAAMALLKQMQPARQSEYIFAGARHGQSISNMAMTELLKGMGEWQDKERQRITTHGFRSTFRTWSAECARFPEEIAKAALAHVVSDKVDAAYQRGDLFEKRRRLMQAWADFCTKAPTTGKVISLGRGRQ
jgi:integrase